LGQFDAAPARVAKSADRPSTAAILGFQAQPITRELVRRYRLEDGMEEGLVITGTDPLGPAAARGVVPGLVLESINGQKVRSQNDLERSAAKLEPGEVVSLIVRTQTGSRQIINYRTQR
jgi:S1-C subfamily serine protease